MIASGRKTICGSVILICITIAGLFLSSTPVFSYPVEFSDHRGRKIRVTKRPERVVSLTPAITEIIFKIGAGDAIEGITHHSSHLPGALHKRIVSNGCWGERFLQALIWSISPDVLQAMLTMPFQRQRLRY